MTIRAIRHKATAAKDQHGPIRAIILFGGSQAANVIISIVRTKLVALLLGPGGIGLLGLYSSLRDIAINIGGLGMSTSGVRQMAREQTDKDALARIAQVMVVSLAIQGIIAATIIYLLRDTLTKFMFPVEVPRSSLAAVCFSIGLLLLASGLSAVIQGMRRYDYLVRVIVGGALIGTVLGISAIVLLGRQGLGLFVLGLAIGQTVVAIWYFRKSAPDGIFSRSPLGEQLTRWAGIARLGLAFMFSVLLANLSLLVMRSLLQDRLGLDALGQFEAAWTLSTTYLGFVLNAMSLDFLPRLSAVIDNRERAGAVINRQIQLSLIFAGPVILVTIGIAPLALRLFYSQQFAEAATILQVQSLGNIFRLTALSLAFSAAAAGKGGTYSLLQIILNFSLGGLSWFWIDRLGINATGAAFLTSYMIFSTASYLVAKRVVDFQFDILSSKLLALYGISALIVFASCLYSATLGAILGLILSMVGALFGLRHLVASVDPGHLSADRIERIFAWLGWPIDRR